jgi:hypothetical protein
MNVPVLADPFSRLLWASAALPSFGLDRLADHTNLKVGSNVAEPVRFTNVGNRPARGVQTVLAASPGLDFADHYSNCKYGFNGAIHFAECYPKGAVNIGETAALAAPPRACTWAPPPSTPTSTHSPRLSGSRAGRTARASSGRGARGPRSN